MLDVHLFSENLLQSHSAKNNSALMGKSLVFKGVSLGSDRLFDNTVRAGLNYRDRSGLLAGPWALWAGGRV